ncbi:pyridoxal-phosphate dependent enzyme [Candidatus Woesearchaeota archaeon]|nr:pyridoxal-phosphate dependent enzyme [Candidatus Woesearchaeota archaeon]
MALDVDIIQEREHPKVMNWELVEKWADGIPRYSENDVAQPEWRATPVFPLDLSPEGYGLVHIKDESDKTSNPTQTIKDRAAWELTTLFRDYARGLYLKRREGLLNGNIGSLVVPRLSYVTAGNVGRAVSNMFKKYSLPPFKLLVDTSISPERLEKLKGLHADIYRTDLGKKSLTPEEIKRLTNNENGIDITSVMVIEPQVVFYDWHVHEVFNEKPNEIYIPYGSGRLFENYVTWQMRNARSQDPRLKIPVGKVLDMSILGAEPHNRKSIADKLTKDYNPFVLFDDQDVAALGTLAFTGRNTGIYKVSERRIQEAYDLLRRHCETEPSASIGLALYMQQWTERKIRSQDKVVIVNTGKGI